MSKKIKLPVFQINNILALIHNDLLNVDANISFCVKMKNIYDSLSEIHKIYKDKMDKLHNKYNVTVDEKGILKFNDESVRDKYEKDREKIESEEVEIEITPLTIDDFNENEIKLSLIKYSIIEPLFDKQENK